MTNGSKVLIYLTPNFQEQLQNFEVAASKFNINRHLTTMTLKGLSANFKKMSWDNPVSPIDAKNSIGFFVQFLLGQPGLLGDSVYAYLLYDFLLIASLYKLNDSMTNNFNLYITFAKHKK